MRVIITGATRGIGAGLAKTYVDQGAEVIGTGRGAGADVRMDVADPGQYSALTDAVGDAPVDLLICNAGVFLDKGHALDTGYDAAIWAQSFAVNVTGVFLTVQHLLTNLRASHAPKIAIISSQMASSTRAPGGSYIYRSSKAAVLNLGRNLASDLHSDGIALGIYHPGWVQTDMGGSAADITIADAVTGLQREFSDLSLATTGCFRTWDGRDHPF
ncbi:MAG: SDR family NAD(P)-dependent oxidoreductase [Paracoccaceae bacterium]